MSRNQRPGSLHNERFSNLQSKLSLQASSPADPSATPNIQGPFPAVVLEAEGGTESLGLRTVLDNLSAREFCLHLAHPARQGKKLLVITQLSQAIVLLRGEVTRVEEHEAGGYRLIVSITQHQIFSSLAVDPSLERSTINDSTRKDARRSDVSPDEGSGS